MKAVETIRGPVKLDGLGSVLMHEHVFVLSPDVMLNYGHQWWDEEFRVRDAIDKLRKLKEVGIDTIVDPTVIGLGRYIPRLQGINAQVDINIIAATGLYIFEAIPHHFAYRGPGTILGGPEVMTDMFVGDIRNGIGGTGVKAAFLKCAVEEPGYTSDQIRVHEAICDAHRETGVPIMVHTNAAHQTGRLAMRFYAERGIDMTRVQIAHAGDSNDFDYLKGILDQGSMIGCDRFGLDMFNPTDSRVNTIASLCQQGYADRIVLGHDADCFSDFFSDERSQATLKQAAPNWHFRFISEDVLPMLRERGVSEAHITDMMVNNPKRFFAAA
jgi:phosphotriesterase-related protein